MGFVLRYRCLRSQTALSLQPHLCSGIFRSCVPPVAGRDRVVPGCVLGSCTAPVLAHPHAGVVSSCTSWLVLLTTSLSSGQTLTSLSLGRVPVEYFSDHVTLRMSL